MIFVPTEQLKVGMRLAKPIYNRKGVMLYERDSKLTAQGINSIRNFELIGIYVLEPAEPLPPLTEEDREFERFQTMSVFVLQDIMQDILKGEAPVKLVQLTQDIIRRFSGKSTKFTFMQNLRSAQDMVFKHSLNVAILAAAIAGRMKLSNLRVRNIVMAALLHDIGSMRLSDEIVTKSFRNMNEEEIEMVFSCQENGYRLLKDNGNINDDVLREVLMFIKALKELVTLQPGKMVEKTNLETDILKVVFCFDRMTAMKYGEEPQSDIAAYQFLRHPRNQMNQQVVNAMTQVIHIVPPGCSVQFVNGEKGIVLTENSDDILRPFVLSFSTNRIYNLAEGKVFENYQIKDIMKTLDNRYIMVDEYKKYLEELKAGTRA